MLVKPKLTNDQLFCAETTSEKIETMYKIKFYGEYHSPIFKIDNCIVKYPLGRFDKLVVSFSDKKGFVSGMNKSLKQALDVDSTKYMPITQDSFGIRVLSKKEDIKLFNKGEQVDVLVQFNSCWAMNGKIYTSFILKDIKASEGVIEKIKNEVEEEFLFQDV